MCESGISERILLVEAAGERRAATAQALRLVGYQVGEAGTGAETLRLAAVQRPDLVVLDVELPDGTGRMLPQRIRALPGCAPALIVAVSRPSEEPPPDPAGGEADSDARLLRPIASDALQVTVRALLRARRAEDALRQAQKLEGLGLFAGGVAHDFNNLLSAIIGLSDLLMLRLEPGCPMHEYAREIHTAGESAAALTRRLLSFSRKQLLRLETLGLREVVDEFRGLLRRVLREDIELVVRHAASEVWVRADRSQLEQVLMNLVVNARDAMPRGGRLTIETGCRPPAPGTGEPASEAIAELVVRDTGIGMDTATQARLFEPFYTTKAPAEGTGLGLAAVHSIVRQLGGRIEVESRPGAGAAFRILFPSVPAVAGEAPSPRVDLSPAVMRRGSETVLLVDDAAPPRRLAREVLVSCGYRVLEAAGPSEALKLAELESGPIHLLLSDMIMPGMNGVELARQVRLRRPTTRVIFTSGYTQDVLGQDGRLPSGTPFLQKPCSPARLLAQVRQILENGGGAAAAPPPAAGAAAPAGGRHG